IVEPDGSRFHYVYGNDGRLLSVERDGRHWAEYRYDAAGRLTELARPDEPLTHSYDEQGRLVRTLRGDASPLLYRWTGRRVASAMCDREESRFQYDARGQLTGLEQFIDGHRLSVVFEFDQDGRLSKIDFPDWHQTIGFGWDMRGRPAAVEWNG